MHYASSTASAAQKIPIVFVDCAAARAQPLSKYVFLTDPRKLHPAAIGQTTRIFL
jgi:hypothetical protein